MHTGSHVRAGCHKAEGTGLGGGCPQAVNGIPVGAIVCHCQSDGNGTCAAALIPGASLQGITITTESCGGCGSCETMCAGFDPNSKTCSLCPAGKTDEDEDPTVRAPPRSPLRQPVPEPATDAVESPVVQTSCVSCATGRYSPQGSNTSDACIDCAPGQADTDTDPSTPCVQCSAGEEALAAPGQTRLTLCSACSDPEFDHDSDPSTPCVCPA